MGYRAIGVSRGIKEFVLLISDLPLQQSPLQPKSFLGIALIIFVNSNLNPPQVTT
jgi:hypothetical protein